MIVINEKLTRRENVKERHIWLNLISSYQVGNIANCFAKLDNDTQNCVYDPFSGSGTTSLIASQLEISSFAADINPFLVWLGRTKTMNFRKEEITNVEMRFKLLIETLKKYKRPLQFEVLEFLEFIKSTIIENFHKPKYSDHHYSLIWVSFCEVANIVLLSSKELSSDFILEIWMKSFREIIDSVNNTIPELSNIFWHDSRNTPPIHEQSVTHVITSPPYPNQVSHLGILKNFMAWSDFLITQDEREKLEVKMVGGNPHQKSGVSYNNGWIPQQLSTIINSSVNNSFEINYLAKYVHDMKLHFQNLKPILKENASLNYIIGDSKINQKPIKVHEIFEDILNHFGFKEIKSQIIRKRKSNNYEYLITAKN